MKQRDKFWKILLVGGDGPCPKLRRSKWLLLKQSMNLSYLEDEPGNYLMKNHLLLVPAEWMLNEEVSKDIEAD